jgi:Mn-dependent DtxR family transcriptional regulator
LLSTLIKYFRTMRKKGRLIMKLLQQIVNQKLNRLTQEDLLKYSKQYDITITSGQANKIVGLIRGKNINMFDTSERARLVKEIAKITSPAIAKQINQLFLQFTGTN